MKLSTLEQSAGIQDRALFWRDILDNTPYGMDWHTFGVAVLKIMSLQKTRRGAKDPSPLMPDAEKNVALVETMSIQ